MSANVSIKALEDELIGMIKELPTFTNKTYSIYTLEDLERFVEGQAANLPLVGVGYDGAEQEGKAVDPKGREVTGVTPVNFQFLVIIVLQYGGLGAAKDNKPDATDLLGEIRQTVLGHRGVSGRAWRFIGERPEPEASGDGVIFYSQVWQTRNIVVGKSTNS